MTNEQEIEIGDVAKVDGKMTELPYEYLNTTVTRAGDAITLDSTLGFTVMCDVAESFCSVNISGWYFGKTAGLFGTYNNEPSDDFVTADRQQTDSVEAFAQSWAVGRCRDPTNMATVIPHTEDRICDKFFKDSSSPLRPCFKVIEPANFYRMCVSDVTRKAKEGECRSAALYRLVCSREAGIEVNMPTECSKCDKPITGQFGVDEKMTITNPPKSADVVFVVEERACNLDAATRMSSLATKIDLELHNQGLKNTRFGLVAYGGDGIHTKPHSHTVGGQIFEDARKMRNSFQSLQMEGSGESDTLGAIAVAADYPFRIGVSKSIILVTCGVCKEAEVDYDDVADMLEDMDITLHVLSEYEFTMEGASKSPKTNYLFGIDAKTAFTVRHVRDDDLNGDEDLFAKLATPETECAVLAQETGGSFFNIKKLTEGRVRFQKSFVDIFSRRVAKDAIPATCQECECLQSNTGMGQTVCTSCIENNPVKLVSKHYSL